MKPVPTRCRPAVEVLEDRTVPVATRLVIDFTPDSLATAQFPGATLTPFARLFRNTPPGVRVPRFLDFNRDGRIDAQVDPTLAARTISALVSNYFRPWAAFDVRVVPTDILSQSNTSTRLLTAGTRTAGLQTFVMYVGGAGSDRSVFGESYQAAVGYNNEDYGRAYTNAITWYFSAYRPNADPSAFARFVASTIAHEFGHMLGLGHPIPDYSNSRNVMDSSAVGAGDAFLNATYQADLRPGPWASQTRPGWQNPVRELTRSFQGQPNENTAFLSPKTWRSSSLRRTQIVDAVFASGHF
jgi:hypothetical protein